MTTLSILPEHRRRRTQSEAMMGISDSRLNRRAMLGGAAASLAATGLLPRATARRAAAQEPATISILTDLPDTDLIAARFMELNPAITVNVEMVTFREVFQQNQVRLGSGANNPDVIAVDAPLVTSYGLRGWLAPLDDAFDAAAQDTWVDAQVEAGIYQEQLLAPPIWNSTQLLFFNVDLLEAAGITPPGPDERWTWEQITEAAQALTTDEVWGFQFEQFNRIYQLQPLPQGKGAPMIGEDGLTVEGIVNSPEWIEAFTWFGDLHNGLRVAPQGNIEVNELFVNQNLAMCVRGPWAIQSFINADLPFQWAAAPHPYWDGGEIIVPTDSWHLGLNPNSPSPEAATAFIQFAASAEAGQLWFEQGTSWPTQKSLLSEIIDNPDNADWPGRAFSIAAGESEFAVPRPLTPGYLEYEEILSNAFEDIRNGTDAASALNGAAGRIEREMQKYRT